MTTALAADVHDCDYLTDTADRRWHLRQLAEQVDRFTPLQVRRALAAWAHPTLPVAERTERWCDLVADVQRLRSLDGLEDRVAYDIAVGTLRADIDSALDLMVGA
jgi:hypothetical protein